MKKRCIFHIPNYIDKNATSGSHIRPVKMIEGFRSLGYDVDVIMGYGHDRKAKIKEIKQNIKNGVKYDFLYSESSTMPTLLTEKNHFPKYPFLDFGFFKVCKRHGIKIGLFYRDMQWKFPFYKASVSLAKRLFSIPMYHYDLMMYSRILDVLYLPSPRLRNYLERYPRLIDKSKLLFPGCEAVENNPPNSREKKSVNIFYVGGVVGIYNPDAFIKAVAATDNINAVICCREKEWETIKDRYTPFIGDKIKVVHAFGKEIDQYYEWADICSVLGGEGEYFGLAMPVKVFEYLGHGKAMIGIEGSVSGDFIDKEDIGWTVPNRQEDIERCFRHILNNLSELDAKTKKASLIKNNNTWQARAEQVEKDLYKGE